MMQKTKLPPPIALPPLQLKHTPGWRLEAIPDEGDLIIFDSDNDTFNLGFAIDVFRDGTMSDSLLAVHPMDERKNLTADALADLGNETDRLQTWFDDLAVVVSWVDEHRHELANILTTPLRQPQTTTKGPTNQ